MAPVAFHLVSLPHPGDSTAFIQALRSLEAPNKPLWAGHCEHWMHEPSLSKRSLLGGGSRIKSWDYLVILPAPPSYSLALPASIANCVSDHWCITTDAFEEFLQELAPKLKDLPAKYQPPLPAGWTADDHQGLDESKVPSDLVLSLSSTSRPLHADSDSETGVDLKTFVSSFGTKHSGPVAMFNLLSFLPGQEQEYMKYVAAFGDVSYGAEPLLFGLHIAGWTEAASDPSSNWDGVALVWYPSVWNFAKMLDDPRYADLDRKFKKGVIKDNPLICCVPLNL